MGVSPCSSPHLFVPADVVGVAGGIDVSRVAGVGVDVGVAGDVDVSGDVADDISVGDGVGDGVGDSVGELLHLFSAV